MKRIIAIALVLSLLIFAAACSNTSGDTETTKATDASETTKATDSTTSKEVEATEFEGKLAWYAPAPHPYFDEVKKGVEKFIADTGIEVVIQIGPDWTQASENEKVEALVAQGITGLSIYPADATGANGLYEEITNAGVNVINFGADSSRPNASVFAVATDVYQSAYDQCEKLIEMMGGKGKLLNVLEVLEDPNTALRKQAIDDCVAKHEGVEIIQEVAGIKTAEEAVTKMESAISANVGNIDGIISTGFNPSIGLAQLLPDYYSKQADSKHIYTIVVDTDPLVMKSIEDGFIDGTMAQNPIGHGYISMMLLKLMEEGYQPINTEKYFVQAGHLFVNKDNLTTFEADIDMVTQGIVDEIETEYLKK